MLKLYQVKDKHKGSILNSFFEDKGNAKMLRDILNKEYHGVSHEEVRHTNRVRYIITKGEDHKDYNIPRNINCDKARNKEVNT